MTLRLHVERALADGVEFALPEGAARHLQVRRAQPGDAIVLFDGSGSEWPAEVLRIGRRDVQVRVGAGRPLSRELPLAVTLAVGMPANERMDGLVEKATELGAAALQPLHCERSVLRLSVERGERKREHWQAVAVAACEQCGRNRVPEVASPRELRSWLAGLDAAGARWLLSPRADAHPAPTRPVPAGPLTLLSGPEGGFSADEEALAQQRGFVPVGLGPRVLRADTAPLALLAWIGLRAA